jgi:hypothetical protein
MSKRKESRESNQQGGTAPELGRMKSMPRFVSFVAIALGCFDIVRGLVHTVFVGSTGVEIAGLDLTGPTGRDQLMLMVAFGSSNFITGIALILLGLTNRLGALIMLAVIPLALLTAGASIEYWGADLVGQGVFPGTNNMRIYVAICILTVTAVLVMRWRGRGTARITR